MTRQNKGQLDHLVNHVGLALDMSYSMHRHKHTVIKVVDELIKSLAQESSTMRQETRISVWVFQDNVWNIIWDVDVLRMPSIAEFYDPDGNTALIDATILGIDDFATVPVKYDDHSFLFYVVTDGQENRSTHASTTLTDRIGKLGDEYTLAALVPDQMGVHYAKRYGFPVGNIDKWDATSTAGIEEAGRRLSASATSYMKTRASGVRGTTTLFSMDPTTLNKSTVKAAGLKPLAADEYTICVVPRDTPIRPFVQDEMGLVWVIGRGHYQLTKREEVQPQKSVLVLEKSTRKVYSGKHARELLGLPDTVVRISPAHNDKYIVFVQSTSVNRKLIAGQQFIYLTPQKM